MRIAVVILFLVTFSLYAQPPARVLRNGNSGGGALKETISVPVENVDTLLQRAKAAGTQPVLFLDGHEISNVYGTLVPGSAASQTGTLLFTLSRDSTNQDAWKQFLSKPSLQPRKVVLSVGLHNDRPLPTDWADFQLTVVHGSWLAAWIFLFIFLLAIFVWKARTTPLLRERGLPGAQAAYSLARCQMAWWFFLSLAAYAFLFMVIWDFNTITPGTLALIGISAGTGLAGAVVDSSNNAQLEGEKEKLVLELALIPPPVAARASQIGDRIREIEKQLATPQHISFFTDILEDSDGISFHRFQIFIWTIVLGIIFGLSVYNDLIMPDFSANLLGLMGISSGTYIGFKFPESKN